ncbi:MAG: hypothetical protein L0H53_11695 [Candidatus Nitrosocosmicus sp.]|nr:hypothetical protein [Candidatus Nitrosocosmicus sp.]MDN5868383.1 hypothetical protein [Candidatus Nitrosocosmicus sp.]
MPKNVKEEIVNHISHSQTINNDTQNERVSDKDILPCDALKCNEKASEKIELSAGIYGNLQINVCKNCIGIFKRGENQL